MPPGAVTRVFRWGLLALLCAGARCEPANEARLLDLHAAGPPQLSAGDVLTIRGAGFPTGRDGRVALTGTLYRAGARPETIAATIPARAAAEDLTTAAVDAMLMSRLGGGGSFEGTLSLHFPGADPDTEVSGALPVYLELSETTGERLRRRHELQRRAERLLLHLGIVTDPAHSTQDGLVLAAPEPGSVAERAGLAEGDVIVRAGGVGVHSLSDLAPPPDPQLLSVHVGRPGRETPTVVSLNVAGFESPSLQAELWPLCVMLSLVLLCIMTLGPFPSLSVWLSRSRARLSGRGALLRVWDDRPPPAPTEDASLAGRLRAVTRVTALPACVTLLTWSCALLLPLGSVRFNPLHVYLGLTVVSVGLTRALGTELAPARRGTLARIQLARMAVVGVAIGCACVLGGTRSLSGIMAHQGGLPMSWMLFSQPAMLLLFPFYLHHGSRVVPLELGEGVRGHAATFVLDVGGRVALSAIGAAIFLGGHQISGIPHADRVDPQLLGAAVWTLKTWLIGSLLHLRRVMAPGRAGGLRAAGLACAVAAGITVLSVRNGVDPQVTLALGHVTCLSLLLAALVASVRLWRSAHPLGEAPRYWVEEDARVGFG